MSWDYHYYDFGLSIPFLSSCKCVWTGDEKLGGDRVGQWFCQISDEAFSRRPIPFFFQIFLETPNMKKAAGDSRDFYPPKAVTSCAIVGSDNLEHYVINRPASKDLRLSSKSSGGKKADNFYHSLRSRLIALFSQESSTERGAIIRKKYVFF